MRTFGIFIETYVWKCGKVGSPYDNARYGINMLHYSEIVLHETEQVS